MPDRIARLPRDKRGFPVPWVSCWDTEETRLRPEKVEIDLGDYLVQVMAADCDHVAGVGTPELAQLCASNQRKGMTERRCDACGDPITGDVHFVGQIRNDWFREPPLHVECAVYSLLVCPGISIAPDIGVQSCADYHLAPSFLLASNVEKPANFPSFADAVAHMLASKEPGVLIDAHANPNNPTVRTRDEFLALYR